MKWTHTRVGVAITALIALLIGALLVVMQFSAALTDPGKPIQVELQYPLVTPQPTATPHPTAQPTPIPPGQELLWAADKYGDSVTVLADKTYQQTADACTAPDFAGLSATASPTNTITLAGCVHAAGYPWVRVALAVADSPTRPPAPSCRAG